MAIRIIKLKDNKTNKAISKKQQVEIAKKLLPTLKKILKEKDISAEVTIN
jgi:hypothetical protein